MKHLSYILALWVLLLSTVPCFLEDKCLFQCANEQTEEPCADNDGSSCTDCNCSPFLHCNTCTGCPIPKLFHSPTAELISHCIYNHRTTKTNQKYPSVNL